jgi:hypothetical protein
MSIRWCHVAQTTQEKDISRRDAKAQRRREEEKKRSRRVAHWEHRAMRFLPLRLCALRELLLFVLGRAPFLAASRRVSTSFRDRAQLRLMIDASSASLLSSSPLRSCHRTGRDRARIPGSRLAPTLRETAKEFEEQLPQRRERDGATSSFASFFAWRLCVFARESFTPGTSSLTSATRGGALEQVAWFSAPPG